MPASEISLIGTLLTDEIFDKSICSYDTSFERKVVKKRLFNIRNQRLKLSNPVIGINKKRVLVCLEFVMHQSFLPEKDSSYSDGKFEKC